MVQIPLRTDARPQQIAEDLWGAWRAQALIAAIELGLFTHIASGKRTVKEIARAAEASERGMRRLLDAMVGLHYLNKKANRYGLEPVAAKFLVRGGEFYTGDAAKTTRLHWDSWAQLTDVVKSGRPLNRVDSEERAREYFPTLVKALFPRSYLAAQAAVSSMGKRARDQIESILDVAAGSGAWSIAFARALPQARVTIVDLPQVTPIARQFAERFGVADRFEYVEGNLREVDFGRDCYDLVILGQILHSEGPVWGKKLVTKSARALRDGGLLLIAEMIPNDARTGPAVPLLFSLNMLLHTDHGDVFTMHELRQWLKEAGFKIIKTIAAPAPSPLILASK